MQQKVWDSLLDLRPRIFEWTGEHFRIIHEKKDGHRVTIFKDGKGEIKAHSKKKYIDLWLYLRHNARLISAMQFIPNWTVLDGELAGECPASEVVTMMKAADQELRFFPFAMPITEGITTFNGSILENTAYLEDLGFPTPEIVNVWDLAKRAGVKPSEFTKEILLAEIELLGWEGFVLKGKHYSEWYKLKLERTVDAKVTHWHPGKVRGVYADRLGSLTVSLWDPTEMEWVEIADVGGGWNKEQRETLKSRECIGRILEVKFDKVESNGRLRFPRFIRWRDDKPNTKASVLLDQLLP